MKKLVLTLALALSTSAFTQIAPPKQNVNLRLNLSNGKNILDNSSNVRVGPIVMLGGASFIVAGMLTPPIMVGGSTTQKQPFYKQVRTLPILTGCIVMTFGIGVSLTGN